MCFHIQTIVNAVGFTAISLSVQLIHDSSLAQSPKPGNCIQTTNSLSQVTNCQQKQLNPLLIAEIPINQLKSINFTDISGVNGETEIRQLAQLGVLETTSGEFRPQAPVTRGQFVAWLVKTYNKLHRDSIRLSQNNRLAFPDVSSSHPHFTFIQAAHNAGFLAGFDDGNFKPDDILTREQMIVLKTTLESNPKVRNNSSALRNYRNFISNNRGFSDAEQINDRYLPYIAFDLGNAAGIGNFTRVYGRTPIYAPQKAVTRAEAALLLSRFRKGGTVEQALKRGNR
ncbi:S-layer homology domain-containing protein [Nostoc spongiaeforme FACHB-130]|uniref:S-layer homology domain-containing protein n=1 Tax=Nostoc spongiaeforme FACHB-130 TaxID=1357510 RepID=A0ABR8FWS9_9NOSO|nr:S-layer homology domain-containing protein [Nostoc spongiaeforme]MBD2595882.1 S-layer homology domain-containing protein [Nostoc spongiaeforme FACHB-130]